MRTKRGLIHHLSYDSQTGCWNWVGGKTERGYGKASFLGRLTHAHRLAAYLWLKHPLDSPLFVLHRCDNPSCFNPKHLFIGTQQDNVMDAVRKGRHRQTKKTHCPKGHPYEGYNLKQEPTGRRCRICYNIYRADLYRRKKLS